MGSKIQAQTNFVRFFGGFKGVRGPDEGVVGQAWFISHRGCPMGSPGTCGSGWVAILGWSTFEDARIVLILGTYLYLRLRIKCISGVILSDAAVALKATSAPGRIRALKVRQWLIWRHLRPSGDSCSQHAGFRHIIKVHRQRILRRRPRGDICPCRI